jgi:GNAT superfamily N-acetyltransferase
MSFRISTETNPAELPWLVDKLLHTYWGWWLNEERIREGVKNSLCFWVHYYEGQISTPIAFARVVTDKTMFSSIVDFFVIEEYQRQGVGRKLSEAVIAHPDVRNTVCILGTRDAEGFYSRFGFDRVTDPVLKRNPA